MPMLLEDLADETAAGIRRAADRLDRELHELNELQAAATAPDELRQRALESAGQATDYALAELAQIEGMWQSTLTALRRRPTGNEAERMLRAALRVFEDGRRLVNAPRPLWDLVGNLGGASQRSDELDQANDRFARLTAEAQRALNHRASGWQPADPDRLAEGLRLARGGVVVSSDDAKSRFRPTGV